MTDPIADMLTRIRNGALVDHDTVDIPGSGVKKAIARIMKDEGYIQDYQWLQEGPQGTLRVYLKYGPNKERVISGIQRVSKPGLRIYAKHHEVPRVLGGLGVAILSTSQGVISDQQARQEKIGGEVLCYIW